VSVHILPAKIGHHVAMAPGYLSEMTLSPDGVLGSSKARRDKKSAWSAINLL
jgi:hypothetical protein